MIRFPGSSDSFSPSRDPLLLIPKEAYSNSLPIVCLHGLSLAAGCMTDLSMLQALVISNPFHRKYAVSVNGVIERLMELSGCSGLAGISSTESHQLRKI